MKTKIPILVALVLFLAVTSIALASNGVEMSRRVLSGGASDSSGGTGVVLRATLGQPVVGVVASGSGDVVLGQGFWGGGISRYTIYLPLIMRNYNP